MISYLLRDEVGARARSRRKGGSAGTCTGHVASGTSYSVTSPERILFPKDSSHDDNKLLVPGALRRKRCDVSDRRAWVGAGEGEIQVPCRLLQYRNHAYNSHTHLYPFQK